MKRKAIAKIIRILTVPPILVSALLTAIYFAREATFRGIIDFLAAILCLAVIPSLAYVIQPLIPKYKDKGRAGQRSLAFITSAAGYVIGFAYAFVSGASEEFKFITAAYLFSVVLLLIFNKLFHLKASGHACGVLGPLLFAIYFLGWTWAIPCAAIAVGVVWSSIRLTRHTPKELCLGGACAMAAFIAVGLTVLL